jgi:hypothetical protein
MVNDSQVNDSLRGMPYQVSVPRLFNGKAIGACGEADRR